MASHPFRIVNVFCQAQESFTGNPLCVFEDGRGLSTLTMQALARQFNLSETTFILPASHLRANARVRIFTPDYEMAFAGHPTLGSAQVCRALNLGGDSLMLEMQAGLIPVSAQGDRWTLTALSSTWRELNVSRDELAGALGVETADIADRPLWVKAGKEQLVVPLRSVDAVRRVVLAPERWQHIRSEDGQSMAYVFAMDGPTRAVARFFFSQGQAMLEDPATGSATANFGAWCLAMRSPLPIEVKISQGERVNRPSTLFLNVSPERQIYVSGEVLEVARGTVTL
jgi:trans-2,3-dihydro-3-hydroxyanthranilate isomerase